MKARAAIIMIENEKIALIERWRLGRHYFVLPGGKVKAGETPEEAAARETEEELGLKVLIGKLVAKIWYLDSPQYYFLAESIDGQFGHGTGAEMSSLPGSEKGSYLPVWQGVDTLLNIPVLPKVMADMIWISHREGWPETPLVLTDYPPDQLENL